MIRDPVFGEAGRLIFPVDVTIPAGMTLGQSGRLFIWYSEINAERTVAVVNDMHRRVVAGERIFYDIYSEADKRADPGNMTPGCSSSGVVREPRWPL